ncbi:MAG TPA: hypothetical protein VHE99_04140 [Gammaproteobacteria bacterium]|nr:hypothetical protein [Gammaproteobacteria bacterium]
MKTNDYLVKIIKIIGLAILAGIGLGSLQIAFGQATNYFSAYCKAYENSPYLYGSSVNNYYSFNPYNYYFLQNLAILNKETQCNNYYSGYYSYNYPDVYYSYYPFYGYFPPIIYYPQIIVENKEHHEEYENHDENHHGYENNDEQFHHYPYLNPNSYEGRPPKVVGGPKPVESQMVSHAPSGVGEHEAGKPPQMVGNQKSGKTQMVGGGHNRSLPPGNLGAPNKFKHENLNQVTHTPRMHAPGTVYHANPNAMHHPYQMIAPRGAQLYPMLHNYQVPMHMFVPQEGMRPYPGFIPQGTTFHGAPPPMFRGSVPGTTIGAPQGIQGGGILFRLPMEGGMGGGVHMGGGGIGGMHMGGGGRH